MCLNAKFQSYWKKIPIVVSFVLFFEIRLEKQEIRQNDILTQNEIITLSKLSFKHKELFDQISAVFLISIWRAFHSVGAADEKLLSPSFYNQNILIKKGEEIIIRVVKVPKYKYGKGCLFSVFVAISWPLFLQFKKEALISLDKRRGMKLSGTTQKRRL